MDMIGLIIYFSIALVIMHCVMLQALHAVCSVHCPQRVGLLCRIRTNAHFGYSASSWIAFSMPLTTIVKRS